MVIYKLTFDNDDDFIMNPLVKKSYFFKTFSLKRMIEIVKAASCVKAEYESQKGYVEEWKINCQCFIRKLKKAEPNELWDICVGGNRNIRLESIVIPELFDD